MTQGFKSTSLPHGLWVAAGLALIAGRSEAQSAAAAQAAEAAQAAQVNQAQRERAQREAEARQAQREAPDVRLPAPARSDYHQHALPAEQPCFRLKALRLEGPRHEDFGFVQRYLNHYAGRCVGQQGLRLIVRRATDLILARGYVTTRLAVPEQKLGTGVLRVLLVPGLVGQIRFAPGSARAFWKNALPLRPGDVLNLRDIEQGLEQLQRLPSQQVTIDIAPGAAADTSDLVLNVVRHKRWRVSLNLDDGGANVTGKEQGGVNIALDRPLGLNDLLVVGYDRHAAHYRDRGTHGVNLNYSIPWQRWTFALSSWDSAYRQPADGGGDSFRFTGTTRTIRVSGTYLLHRDTHSKTSLQAGLLSYNASSYINGEAIDVQHRQKRAIELALLDRRYLGPAQLDLRLACRRAVPWFGGQWQAPRPEIADGASFRYQLFTFDAGLSWPFRMLHTGWLWTSELHAQQTGDHLYSEDYLAIGGRYTVRGFDGNLTLGGTHGAYWRNDLALPLGNSGVAVYAGIDVGRVGGGTQVQSGEADSLTHLSTHTLSGGALGLKGGRWGFNWDLFAGWAFQRPTGFGTRRPATGFSWLYTF